jgi:phosphoribosyl 1,2-cyclic phosphodiesterase
MSLKLVSLASGSKGNATLIFSDNTALLVDAGISYTRISEELKIFGLTPSMLDGIVVTHEHADHICGVRRMSECTKIFAHPLTARAMCLFQDGIKNIVDVPFYENGFVVGDIRVHPFRIPHDAAYPLGYTLECGGARVSVATDIGRPTVGVFKNISSSSVVLLEANHDLTMLKYGSYPERLKSRIMGENGHLSNDAAALIAQRLAVDSRVKTLLLGHISENNNKPELAKATVCGALEKCPACDMEVFVASQRVRSEVFETR